MQASTERVPDDEEKGVVNVSDSAGMEVVQQQLPTRVSEQGEGASDVVGNISVEGNHSGIDGTQKRSNQESSENGKCYYVSIE